MTHTTHTAHVWKTVLTVTRRSHVTEYDTNNAATHINKKTLDAHKKVVSQNIADIMHTAHTSENSPNCHTKEPCHRV